MKRLHVHVSVEDVNKSIGFYSKLFGCDPAIIKSDYAKWLPEDLAVNFAISSRGAPIGVDHLGIQVLEEEDLAPLVGRVEDASGGRPDIQVAECCYAQSAKHWAHDPAGLPWEMFHTLKDIPLYGTQRREEARTVSEVAVPAVEQGGSRCGARQGGGACC